MKLGFSCRLNADSELCILQQEKGHVPAELESKIAREQRLIVTKMCTDTGHLIISIAR